jgi:integrase
MHDIPTVREAFEAFLPDPRRKLSTRRKYSYKLAPFLKEFGCRPITVVDEHTLTTWFQRLEERYAVATVSMHRTCHLAFYNYCISRGWLATNPAVSLPRYNDRPPWIKVAPEADVEKALIVCEEFSLSASDYERRDGLIFALAAISGARRSNVLQMPYRETKTALLYPIQDDDVGCIYTVVTPGKTVCELVFSDWHATLIRRYLTVRPDVKHNNRLFVHLHPLRGGSYGDPLGENGIAKARQRVCAAAGVPVISFQGLRKLKGTQLARKYGLELAATALGHTSGTRVVREFYYDPDKHAARAAILETFKRVRG